MLAPTWRRPSTPRARVRAGPDRPGRRCSTGRSSTGAGTQKTPNAVRRGGLSPVYEVGATAPGAGCVDLLEVCAGCRTRCLPGRRAPPSRCRRRCAGRRPRWRQGRAAGRARPRGSRRWGAGRGGSGSWSTSVRDLDEQQRMAAVRSLDPALLVTRLVRVVRLVDVLQDLLPPLGERIGVVAVDGRVRDVRGHDVSLTAAAGPANLSGPGATGLGLARGRPYDEHRAGRGVLHPLGGAAEQHRVAQPSAAAGHDDEPGVQRPGRLDDLVAGSRCAGGRAPWAPSRRTRAATVAAALRGVAERAGAAVARRTRADLVGEGDRRRGGPRR